MHTVEKMKCWCGVEGDGERLVSCSDDHTMMLWAAETSSKPVSRMTGHQQQVNQVVFSPDARLIASASFDKSVKLWDGYTGKWVVGFTVVTLRLSDCCSCEYVMNTCSFADLLNIFLCLFVILCQAVFLFGDASFYQPHCAKHKLQYMNHSLGILEVFIPHDR